MTTWRLVLASTAGLTLACTRTIIVTPAPQPDERRGPPPASTAAILGIPPGHLPEPGECRIWIPGTPPGRQPRPRSRDCYGIARLAPGGSWIIYRPTLERGLVHVRVVDERRPGVVTIVRIFDLATGRLVRDAPPPPEERPRPPDMHPQRPEERPRPPEERPRPPEERPQPPEERRRPPDERPKPPEERPKPAEERPNPPEERRKPPEEQPKPQEERPKPPEEQPGREPSTAATLGIPPGHLPDPGECRIWIPGTPPGQQRSRASGDCDAITRSAPAGSWIVYRPTDDKKLVHVRVVDARRAGVVVRIQIFDIDSGRLVREENP